MTNEQAKKYAVIVNRWSKVLIQSLNDAESRDKDISLADPPLSESAIAEIATSGQAAIQRILDSEPTRESVIDKLENPEIA